MEETPKILVSFVQFSKYPPDSLQIVSPAFQAEQIMKFVHIFKEKKRSDVLVTSQEIHVLRLLRLIREEVDGLRLTTKELVFTFDSPYYEKGYLLSGPCIDILPTEDGDLAGQVPGGFFTARFPELF